MPRGIARPSRARRGATALCAALTAVASACTTHTVNAPLQHIDPTYGYRPSRSEIRRERGDAIVYVAFSGGGTRAAALAYGVLEALRDTMIGGGEEPPRSLLDEVDTLSGVSGGSFPAAYYGLFGDRIFDEFEPRFLRRNVQQEITLRAMLPWNLVRLLTPWLTRSDIAMSIYHDSVFDEATFETLTDAHGPIVYINATDLSSGERFTFVQAQFDLICSDLQALPVAYAVAASSAVPMLLSPVSLDNHAGHCDFEPPPFLEAALSDPHAHPRQYRVARAIADLHDANKRYVHLVDGGISDNLGLRAGIDLIELAGSFQAAGELTRAGPVSRLAVIVVNAETDPDPRIDLSSAPPGFAALMSAVSGGQIRRYNFETLLLAQELLGRLDREAEDRGVPMETFLVDVSFDEFADEAERRYFKRMPTNFHLDDRQVDELRWAGRELLLHSRDYELLVESLGGTPAPHRPRPGADD